MILINSRWKRKVFASAAITGLGALFCLTAVAMTAKRAPLGAHCKVCEMTPSPQTATPFTLMSVPTGSNYAFAIDSSAGFTSGGSWRATFGQIDASGNYTAPTFIPPYGLDEVSYTDPNGQYAHVSVSVNTNPNGPAPTTPPITIAQVPANPMFHAAGQDTTTPISTATASASSSPTPAPAPTAAVDAALDSVTATLTDQTIIQPDAATYPSDVACVDDSTTTAAPIAGAVVVPATINDTATNLIYAAALGTSPTAKEKKKCNIGYPPPGCTGSGYTTMWGTTQYYAGKPYHVEGETISVTFHGVVGVKVNLGYRATPWKSYVYGEKFKCVNGQWTWVQTIICESSCIKGTWDSAIAQQLFNPPNSPWNPVPPLCHGLN